MCHPSEVIGYRDSLSSEKRKVYDERLKFTAGIDPYSVNGNFISRSMEKWPGMLFSTTRFTKEQLKAYKSLQASQFFVAGWVRSLFEGS